jgi:hypothetical protein
MKHFVTLVAILLVSFILVQRNHEMYTNDDRQKIHTVFTGYNAAATANLQKYLMFTILNELDGNTTGKISNVNMLVDTLNIPRTSANAWTHYETVNDFDTMLETAYNSGESGLSVRDRMVLRAIALPGIDFTIDSPLNPITFTSENVPDYSSNVIQESGKTPKEMLLFCFKTYEILIKAFDTLSGLTPEAIDYINSYLPDKYAPKFNRDSPTEFISLLSATDSDKMRWVYKAISLGPAYIARLAETKWKLDLTWTPT